MWCSVGETVRTTDAKEIFFDSSLIPSTKFAWSPFIRTRRVRGVPIRNGSISTRRPPSTRKMNGTDASGGNSIARQCALVSDS